MRTEINKLHIRLQATMIYVTHDQMEAMTLGTRIAVMKDGKVQQFDDPLSVYDKPANKFVAGFIGSPPMNFVDGKIIKKDNNFYFDEGRSKLRVVNEMCERISPYEGKKVIFGIRPSDIYDKLFVQDASADSTVNVTCEVIEPMGSESFLYLNTGMHSIVARVGGHDRPQVNQDMDIVLDMSKAHFFDSETEKTIV